MFTSTQTELDISCFAQFLQTNAYVIHCTFGMV
jgi:hypothetical protein